MTRHGYERLDRQLWWIGVGILAASACVGAVVALAGDIAIRRCRR